MAPCVPQTPVNHDVRGPVRRCERRCSNGGLEAALLVPCLHHRHECNGRWGSPSLPMSACSHVAPMLSWAPKTRLCAYRDQLSAHQLASAVQACAPSMRITVLGGRQAGCCSWCLRAWAWSRCRSIWCRASWGARWPSSRRASTSSARAAWASAPPPSRCAPDDVAWHLRTLWKVMVTSGGCQDLHFLGLHCRGLPREVALQHQAGSARHALATACIALVQARGLDQAMSPVVGQSAWRRRPGAPEQARARRAWRTRCARRSASWAAVSAGARPSAARRSSCWAWRAIPRRWRRRTRRLG